MALTLISILPLRLEELRATHLTVLCSVPLSNTLYRKTGNCAAFVFIPVVRRYCIGIGYFETVITYGTFDLLHYGHINLLRRAKALGEYLIVVISFD